jgi:hypothetical protein
VGCACGYRLHRGRFCHDRRWRRINTKRRTDFADIHFESGDAILQDSDLGRVLFNLPRHIVGRRLGLIFGQRHRHAGLSQK